MDSVAYTLDELPESLRTLREIPEPPERLYVRGTLPRPGATLLAVVGSRKWSAYGREACMHLIKGLAGTDVAIVSGLALGIDSFAHRAALDAGLHTIAVPGSGLSDDAIYPHEHIALAREILAKGGALVSEFEPDFRATPWAFPKRNRLMAGMSRAVLIVEAAQRSGTLITARLALDYGRDILAVPGSIFSPGSAGIHYLLREGATPVATQDDLRDALGLPPLSPSEMSQDEIARLSPEERMIIEALTEAKTRNDIADETAIEFAKLNAALTLLEIRGFIKEEGGRVRRTFAIR